MKTRSERNWLVGIAAALIIITTIPYLVGYASENDQWKFSGFLFGVEDGNSYIAKMLNGMSGEWLFRTPYTTMKQDGMLAFLPYILLGKLASEPGAHDQLVAIFTLFRWVGIFLFVFASYDFVSLFLEKTWVKRWAVVVICIGGGLGIFFPSIWGSRGPLDFYSPETFGFLELLGLPHLAVARALLLWGLVMFLKEPERGWSGWKMVLAGLLWFGIGFFQPIHIAIGWTLVGVFLVYRIATWRLSRTRLDRNEQNTEKELLRRAAVIIPASAFWVFYNAYIFLADPYGRTWMAQNILLSPSFISYLLAYGWLLPGIVLGVRHAIRKKSNLVLFLILWAAVLPILAYAPTNIQRRLVEGGWVALVTLAFLGIESLPGINRKLLVILLTPLFFSNLLFMSGMYNTALHPARPAFLPATEVMCYKELSRMAKPDEVVLANREVSNSLPSWANVRTILGHGPESPGNTDLELLVRNFFADGLAYSVIPSFLDRYSVDLIFFGKTDLSLVSRLRLHNIQINPIIEGPDCKVFAAP